MLVSRNTLRRGTKVVLPNILRTMTSPLGGLVVSWMILHLGSRDLLNSYVRVLLVQALAMQLIGWGMRDYLFKAFGANPSRIPRTLGEAFAAKGALLVPATLVLALVPGISLRFLPVVWGSVVLRSALLTFEPLVNFRRAYGFAAAVDLSGIAVFALLFLFPGERTLIVALIANLGADLARIAAYLIRFRRDRPAYAGLAVATGFLRATFPFFLTAAAGYFVARVDVYCLGFFAHSKELGQYHVLVNFLQSLTAVLSAIPGAFAVTLYRSPSAIFRRAFRSFFLAGLLVAAPAIVAIRVAMQFLYGLLMSPLQLLLAGLFAAGFLLVLKSFYAITKDYHQRLVIIALLVGGGANLVVSVLLVPAFGITGALAASACGQWSTYLSSTLLVYRHARIHHHDHL